MPTYLFSQCDGPGGITVGHWRSGEEIKLANLSRRERWGISHRISCQDWSIMGCSTFGGMISPLLHLSNAILPLG